MNEQEFKIHTRYFIRFIRRDTLHHVTRFNIQLRNEKRWEKVRFSRDFISIRGVVCEILPPFPRRLWMSRKIRTRNSTTLVQIADIYCRPYYWNFWGGVS